MGFAKKTIRSFIWLLFQTYFDESKFLFPFIYFQTVANE